MQKTAPDNATNKHPKPPIQRKSRNINPDFRLPTSDRPPCPHPTTCYTSPVPSPFTSAIDSSMTANECLEAVILGIVQGVAEFLPVSSSGHLVILQRPLQHLLGTSSGEIGLELNIALHLGTLLSIVLVFRKPLRQTLQQPRLITAMFAATLPIVVVGLAFKDAIETLFRDPVCAGFGLLLTSGLLLLSDRFRKGQTSIDQLTWKQGVLVGLFQAVAIIPGVSRSGSTITGGCLTGLDRNAAAVFSFLIAIPAIGGASTLLLIDFLKGEGTRTHAGPLLLGAATACLVGVLSLKWLMRIVTHGRLAWFGVYCAIVGLSVIALGLTGCLDA